MEGSDRTAARRAARNQSLFRGVNDRIDEVTEAFRVNDIGDAHFVCECANDSCLERVALTLADYQEIRRIPTHFVVRPGHVYPEFERVVAEADGHVVVEKFGAAGAEAVAVVREGESAAP